MKRFAVFYSLPGFALANYAAESSCYKPVPIPETVGFAGRSPG